MIRRELANTLFDLTAVWDPIDTSLVSVSPRTLEITQPIEVRMKLSGSEPTLYADAPSFSWQTAFDGHSGSLSITLEAAREAADLIALANYAEGSPA